MQEYCQNSDYYTPNTPEHAEFFRLARRAGFSRRGLDSSVLPPEEKSKQHRQMEINQRFPRMLAAPSWVKPGSILANCRFLSTKVDEAALLFFETRGSLAYTEADLPGCLADLPLSYHAHLPTDLPWERPRHAQGAEDAAYICGLLLDKVAHLAVRRAVLHPPNPLYPGACLKARQQEIARKLADFARAWRKQGRDPADILLENTRENSLHDLTEAIEDEGFSLCMDLGHMLAYTQPPLPPKLLRRARMLHLSAPGKGEERGRHLPLTQLTPEERQKALALCRETPQDAVVVLELFDWEDFTESLPLAREMLTHQV